MTMPQVALPDDVREFVESSSWRFARTYAATWPHEYIVRTPENAAMILALARHILDHGTDGRFYSQVRKSMRMARFTGRWPTPRSPRAW